MAIEHVQVYRVCSANYVRPHNGYGSTMRNGGRWNSNKYPCIYTGSNRSVAQLEWVSHLLINEFDFPNLIMITYEIPKNQIFVVDMSEHPDWIHNQTLTKRLGDEFLSRKEYIALCVPSAMDPKELNYIINPNHPDFLVAGMVINDTERLVLNKRFLEVKELVKSALSLEAKLDKYVSEDKSKAIFKRSRQSRFPKK